MLLSVMAPGDQCMKMKCIPWQACAARVTVLSLSCFQALQETKVVYKHCSLVYSYNGIKYIQETTKFKR
jgi:hypothetical protein